MTEALPTKPERVIAFANFFKRYMSVSSVVVASLPIPVTSLHLIPTFTAQTKLLSVYTSLFCFLTLGFIFYSRHQLARLMFPEYFDQEVSLTSSGSDEENRMWIKRDNRRRMRRKIWREFIVGLPLLFIAASLVATFQYNDVLNLNVQKIALASIKPGAGLRDFRDILEHTDLMNIEYGSRLMILYIAIFVTAEAAFIMMAIKEYLQDIVGLTEMDLIKGYQVGKVEINPAAEKS
jgi:hypothetical protein